MTHEKAHRFKTIVLSVYVMVVVFAWIAASHPGGLF